MTYRANPNDPHRAGRSEEEMRRDNELQADPQLAEGPASGTKVAMYAIGDVKDAARDAADAIKK